MMNKCRRLVRSKGKPKNKEKDRRSNKNLRKAKASETNIFHKSGKIEMKTIDTGTVI